MPETVQDFGEKIGGARKDLWGERGLLSSDLSAMNEREAEKFVKKDNVWKKNDYQAMIENGIPVDVVYFIKTVRDSIAPAPVYLRADNTAEKRLDRQKQYVDTVRELESILLAVKTKEDALAVFQKFFVDNGYIGVNDNPGISRFTQYTWSEKRWNNPVITDKLYQTIHLSGARYEQNIEIKAAKEQFGVPKEDKVPRGYDLRFNSSAKTHSGGDWEPDTWYVTKGNYVLKNNFATREDALQWAQEQAGQQNSDRKKRFVPPQLEHVNRIGPDYRRGRDVQGQDYLDTFSFKGGEFGNWMSQNDRQASLNLGYDALKDLADTLRIADKDISYGGALSIAFGARGSGNAVAHYEPLRSVINLTKMRGAGSLAHEWWHGLDDYLGGKLGAGGYLSDHAGKLPSFQKLLDVIKYKPETPEQAAERAEKQNERMRKNADNWLKSATSTHLQALPEYETLRQGFLRGEAGSIENISALQKAHTGRIIPKAAREQLDNFERWLGQLDTAPTVGKVMTDYLRNSKEMGQFYEKEGGYWDSNVELTARAFATYVMDTLGRRSDYLIGHAECAINIVTDKEGKTQVLRAYPQGEERSTINRAFDEVVAELKQQHYLTHAERPAPQIPAPAPSENVPDRVRIEDLEQPSLFQSLFYSQPDKELGDEDLDCEL